MLYLTQKQSITQSIKIGSFFCSILGLGLFTSGCQSLSTPSTTAVTPATRQTDSTQAKTALTQAIEHTLYRNQDWIAEHQLYFVETPEREKGVALDGILGCQQRHDDALVAQMRQDHLKAYAQVATLSDAQKKPYEAIKQTYLACYKTAESQINEAVGSLDDIEPSDDETTDKTTDDKTTQQNLATSADNNQTDNEKAGDSKTVTEVPDIVNKVNTVDEIEKKDKNTAAVSVLDDIEPISEIKQMLSILGLNDEQVKSINTFVAKSGKITTTGNYRPFSGYMAMQVDASFENKNLKYHYRLPLVANWKTQAVYVKPDIIMPTVALYLDNKMGMSWQDKWYKFYPSQSQKLPLSMTSKNWLIAFKDSVKALPASQFEYANATVLIPNIAYARQKIATNGTIIHWQQTAKQQQDLYRSIMQRYIALMDKQIGEKTEQNAEQYQAWQNYKQKLTQYMTSKFGSDDNNDNDKDIASVNDALLGQDMYFVLSRGQVKQVFATHATSIGGQPSQLQTWITFDPEINNLEKENQPKILLQLASSIHDGGTNNNVLDGQQEIDRIIKLDKSRRLFGKDPAWLDVLKRLQKNREDKPAEQDY